MVSGDLWQELIIAVFSVKLGKSRHFVKKYRTVKWWFQPLKEAGAEQFVDRESLD